MKFNIDIVKEMYGAVEVEADSYEDALKYVGNNYRKFLDDGCWVRHDEDVLRVCDSCEEHSVLR